MKTEVIKQFIKKTVIKVLVFVVVMSVVTAIIQSVSPTITNEIALSQMQNNNESFILINAYDKIRPMINLVYLVISAMFVYTLGRDTYKFVKTINNENTMEEN